MNAKKTATATELEGLQIWQAAIEAADAKISPVMEVLKLPPESPVFEAVSGLQDALTAVVAAIFDDADGSIAWYWLENGMGRKGLDAHPAGEAFRPIRTLDDLLWLMGYEKGAA